MVEAAKAQKKAGAGKNALIAAVVFALLAIGGTGFGVWAMMDGQAQKEKIEKDLKSQISSLKQSNEELQAKLNESSSNNSSDSGDTIINIDTNSDVNPEDYIYVGEWGMKIKIPEGLRLDEFL